MYRLQILSLLTYCVEYFNHYMFLFYLYANQYKTDIYGYRLKKHFLYNMGLSKKQTQI